MTNEIPYALVKIVKGKSADAHIIFDRDDEGFHIGIADTGSDIIKTFVCNGNIVKVWKTYTSALKEAKKQVLA